MEIINLLKKEGGYELKGVGEPEYYLGGDVLRKKDKNGERKTTLLAKTYIKNICDKVEKLFNISLRNYHSPLEGGYHPELDTTELLDKEEITKYRMLVGTSQILLLRQCRKLFIPPIFMRRKECHI